MSSIKNSPNRCGFFRFILFVALFNSVFIFQSAHAFRCSGKIISEGDSKFEVLSRCGEPDYVEQLEDQVFIGEKHFFEDQLSLSKAVSVRVYQWVYNLGRNRLMQVLTFKNEKLVKIESAGYGY